MGSYRIDDGSILRNNMNQRFIDTNGNLSQQLSSTKQQQKQQKPFGMKRKFATDLETRLESITDNKKRNIYDNDEDNYNKDLNEDVLKSLGNNNNDDVNNIDNTKSDDHKGSSS